MKILSLLAISLFVVAFQFRSCGNSQDVPKVQLKGNTDRNDLVFFYKRHVSYEERRHFEDNVLGKSRPESPGRDLPDGVIDMFLVAKSGYRGFALNFSKGASKEQRQRLKETLESSPLIYRVYENIVPEDIDDLEN